MAGYSGTPLPQKLGIKPRARVALLRAPADFVLGETPTDAVLSSSLRGKRPFDVILFFTDSRAVLGKEFRGLTARLATAGGLWISWPKKASGVPTDITEDIIRALALPLGLVDVKVCAVDDVWSGLKLVIRKERR